MWGPQMRFGWSRDLIMISPSEMYFASTPVIALKSNGCSRFPECPRAGGGGWLISFKRPTDARRMGLNPDVAEYPVFQQPVPFLCNLGYGDASKLYPCSPRLAFEEACSVV